MPARRKGKGFERILWELRDNALLPSDVEYDELVALKNSLTADCGMRGTIEQKCDKTRRAVLEILEKLSEIGETAYPLMSRIVFEGNQARDPIFWGDVDRSQLTRFFESGSGEIERARIKSDEIVRGIASQVNRTRFISGGKKNPKSLIKKVKVLKRSGIDPTDLMNDLIRGRIVCPSLVEVEAVSVRIRETVARIVSDRNFFAQPAYSFKRDSQGRLMYQYELSDGVWITLYENREVDFTRYDPETGQPTTKIYYTDQTGNRILDENGDLTLWGSTLPTLEHAKPYLAHNISFVAKERGENHPPLTYEVQVMTENTHTLGALDHPLRGSKKKLEIPEELRTNLEFVQWLSHQRDIEEYIKRKMASC